MFERVAQAYGWPCFGGEAELRSLAYHVGLRDGIRKDGPSQSARTMILERTEESFLSAKWSIPDDFLSYEHYVRVVGNLDWGSSPGYPYMRRHPTNRDMFAVVDGVPAEQRLLHVWDIIQDRLRERDSDPIRLFVKPEPHKIKKLQDGRYRLISSVSVIDQILDHMLFGEMNSSLIANWPFVPSKAGWNQYQGGWRMMPSSGKWMALDKQSWDWTVQMWILEMVLEIRCRLCCNLTEEWRELAVWRYRQLFSSPEFITSGGMVFRQKFPGVMKSGCVNTIADNSIAQVILHNRVCQEIDEQPGLICCMGDDTLQEIPVKSQEYLDVIANYCIIKPPVYKVEFAGMQFHGHRVEPSYRGKHAYTLLHVDPQVLPQLANSYALLYHRSECRDLMEDLLLKMGQEVQSRQVRDAIYDGF